MSNLKSAFDVIKANEPHYLRSLTIGQINELKLIKAEVQTQSVLVREFSASSRVERFQDFAPGSTREHVPVDTIYYHSSTRSELPNDGTQIFVDPAGTIPLSKAHPLNGDYNYYVGVVDGEPKWFNVDANGICQGGLKTFEDLDRNG